MPEYQLRVLTERDELATRLSKLRAFLESDAYQSVDPPEQSRLLAQAEHMGKYLAVLNDRIIAFQG